MGDENDLAWSIESRAADGSGNPVIAYIAGTGKARVAARSALAVASGYALIAPLREGTAVISISHPKAVYDTKILVEVAPARTVLETSWVLSSATPYISLQNGSSREISVYLDGPGRTDADTAAIVWEYAGNALSLAANGGSAQVTATGQPHYKTPQEKAERADREGLEGKNGHTDRTRPDSGPPDRPWRYGQVSGRNSLVPPFR